MSLMRAIIKIYQIVISPAAHLLFGPSVGCRHTPTCSEYFLISTKKMGFIQGGMAWLKRFCGCHPFAREYNSIETEK